jgi:RNA-directed DNA polymerase
MVYGHEESDFAIVAVKPANKVAHPAVERSAMGPAAAEPVEPRAETEGNADQQSTCRAQSRVSVSQALDRIRKVATPLHRHTPEVGPYAGKPHVRFGAGGVR